MVFQVLKSQDHVTEVESHLLGKYRVLLVTGMRMNVVSEETCACGNEALGARNQEVQVVLNLCLLVVGPAILFHEYKAEIDQAQINADGGVTCQNLPNVHLLVEV